MFLSSVSKFFTSGKPFGQITKEQTSFIKGIAILAIVFHNYFHWVGPSTGENEMDFSISRIVSFGRLFIDNPLEIINLIFSYFGHFGVQIFIFASGYGLVKASQNKTIPLTSFLGRRMSKLYPTFLLSIFVYFILIFYTSSSFPGEGWIRDVCYKILMVSNIVPDQLFSVNGPWWFYSLIFQFYLVFPLLKQLYEKFKGKIFIIISIIAYLLMLFCNYFFFKHGGVNLMGTFIGHLPEFLLGMYLALRHDITIKRWFYICALLVFALGNVYSWAWVFSFIAISILGIGIIRQWTANINSSKSSTNFIVHIGNISMYLFAIHGFIRKPFVDMAKNLDNFSTTILLGIAFFLLSLILAYGIKELEFSIKKVYNFNIFQLIKNKLLYIFKKKKNISLRADFGRHFIIFFVFSIILRIVEFITGCYTGTVGDVTFKSFLTHFWTYDFVAYIKIGTAFFTVFSIIYIFSKTTANIVAKITVFIYCILSIFLIIYFQYAKTPLDHSIFNYNFSDAAFIVSSTMFPQIYDILLFVFGILTLCLFYYYFRFRNINMLVNVILGTGLLFWIFQVRVLLKLNTYKHEQIYFCNVNKTNLFIDNCFNYLVNNKNYVSKASINQSINRYQNQFPEKQFMGQSSPLWNNTNFGNVLGPYFQSTTKQPNIVFLIVESLSGRTAGYEAEYKGFTPFIDSLSHNGLYWPNTLSITERTFGVLPSVLGSLPFGINGFTSTLAPMPRHISLLSELKNKGYYTAFHYGGNPSFDNMINFLIQNNVDFYLSNSDISKDPNKDTSFITTSEYSKWGYLDKTMFEKAIEKIKQYENKNPRLDAFLTLSTHNPFDIPDKDNYLKKVDSIFQTNKTKGTKAIKDYLSTLIYADEQIKNFFSMYRQLPEYENTIFIITGDHSSECLPYKSILSKYHVPLIIFSPLLKSTASFKAVNTHFDILPSLRSLLKNNFNIQLTDENAFMGDGLDTSASFVNKHSLAFMRNNRNVLEYLSKDLFYFDSTLYKLKDNLYLEQINNVSQSDIDNIKQELDDYIAINQYAWKNDKIIPYNITDTAFSGRIVHSNLCNFEDIAESAKYKNRISYKEKFSGVNSIHIERDNEFSFVTDAIKINNQSDMIIVNVSAKVFLIDDTKTDFPFLVCTIKNNDEKEHFIYSQERLFNLENEILPIGKWIDYNYTRNFYIDDKNNSDLLELNIYFWNSRQSEMYYDDINVSVFVK